MNNIYLQHHGIKGMRWGIRRFQNEDGTLNAKGLKRQKRQDSRRDYIKSKIVVEKKETMLALKATAALAAASLLVTYKGDIAKGAKYIAGKGEMLARNAAVVGVGLLTKR